MGEKVTKASMYAEGYQAGMQDIYDAMQRDGLDGVKQWLSNNYYAAAGRSLLVDDRTREQSEWVTAMHETPERPR